MAMVRKVFKATSVCLTAACVVLSVLIPTAASAQSSQSDSALNALVPLIEAGALMSKGKWAEAEAVYSNLSRNLLAAQNPDVGLILRVQQNLALAQVRQNHYGDAELVLANLLDFIRQTENTSRNDYIMITLTLTLFYLEDGKYDAAGDLIRPFAQTAESKHFADRRFVQAYGLYANILIMQGRASEARSFLDARIPSLRREISNSNAQAVVRCILMLGSLMSDDQNAEKADVLYKEALQIVEKYRKSNILDPQLAIALSRTLFHQGRNSEAVNILEEVERGNFKKNERGTSDYFRFLAVLGAAYIDAGQTEKGEGSLKSIINGWPSVGRPDDPLIIAVHSALGITYSNSNRLPEAEQEFRTVISLSSGQSRSEVMRTANAQADLGVILAKMGKVPQGESLILKARRESASIASIDRGILFNIAIDLAQVRLLSGVAADAISPARESLLLWRESKRKALVQGSGSIATEPVTKQAADPTVSGPEGIFAEAAWRASRRKPKEQAVLGGEALVALQEGTAGAVSQAVVQAAARSIAERRVPGLGALVRERQALSSSFSGNEAILTQARIARVPQDRMIKKLETAQLLSRSRAEQIDSEIRKSFPDFARFTNPGSLDVSAVRALLARDEGLLFVVPTAYGTQTFAVTGKGFAWHRSDWTSDKIGKSVQRLLWDCGADVSVDAATTARWSAEAGPGYSYDRKTAFALYSEAVAPVAQIFVGKRKLFVIASGALSSIPFEILLTQAPKGRDSDPQALRSSAWFADSFVITTVPTIQSLQLLRSQSSPIVQIAPSALQGFAGFGDPVLSSVGFTRGKRSSSRPATLPSVTRSKNKGAGLDRDALASIRALPSLPGTATELEGMRKALGAGPETINLRDRDTEQRFKEANLTEVGVLALATHGLMANELRPGAQAGLVFSPPKEASERDDGYLTASEILALKLRADWVILSACNTAAGDGTSGAEGLSGLARSFFYAGAHDLLVSRWPVRDEVAPLITVEAIRIRKSSPEISRSEAIQIAARKVRNDASHDSPDDTWAHPNAWAPFSSVGGGK